MGPAWADLFVFTLAAKTGWTDDYIRRRISFARAIRLYHCAIWSEGAWTVKASARQSVSNEFDHLMKIANTPQDNGEE
jgi:hypothetical protein